MILIQLDNDHTEGMYTSVLDLTFGSTGVRHWVMAACVSAVEKDSKVMVLFSRVVYDLMISAKFSFVLCTIHNQHVSIVSDQAVSLKMDLYICNRVEDLKRGPPP